MKYLSRCLALLLVAAMAVLAGCAGAPQGAFEAYEAAMEKFDSLESLHATQDVKAKVSVSGVSVDVPVKADLKIGKDGSMSMSMEMSVLRMTMEIPMYYADDVLYMEMFGMKVKMPVTDELLEEEMDVDSVTPQFNLPEEALKDASFEKKDGNTVYSAEFDGQLIAEELLELVTPSLENAGEDVVLSSVTFGAIKYSYTIDKNGYLAEQNLVFSITFTADGTEASGEFDMTFKLVDAGKDVTPDKPADLSEYQDLSDIEF